METINVQIKVRGNCAKEDVENWIATCFCFPKMLKTTVLPNIRGLWRMNKMKKKIIGLLAAPDALYYFDRMRWKPQCQIYQSRRITTHTKSKLSLL